jgi:acyl-CoA thioester hydrolase
MPRIHVELPESFLYTTELSVRVSDLNYGGHLGHDTLLTLLQEARVLFYRSLGYRDETSFEGSIGQIIADVAVQYKSESFLGDQLIISIGVTDATRYGFDMVYHVMNKTTGKDVAMAKTGIVCFDYEKRKVAAIPGSLAEKLHINH